MSTAILDRQQGRSGERVAAAIAPVRTDVPVRRSAVGRPASRRPPVALPAARSVVACAGVAGARPVEHGYRMGRAARLAVTFSVLATALILVFGGPANSAEGTVAVVTTSEQSIWSIARAEAGPTADPQVVGAMVDEIRTLNGLQAVAADELLAPGQTLKVPVG